MEPRFQKSKSALGFTLAVFALLTSILMILTLLVVWINLSSNNPSDLTFMIVSLLGTFLLLSVSGFQFYEMGQRLMICIATVTLCIGSWLACWNLSNISNLPH